MFVGHLGVGLAAKLTAPRVSLGVLFLAAMLLDAVLWIFVLLGIEQLHVPENFGEMPYLTFTFPYSHGLIASLLWSTAAILAGSLRLSVLSRRAGRRGEEFRGPARRDCQSPPPTVSSTRGDE